MMPLPPASPSVLTANLSRPVWSSTIPGRPRGLILSREKHTVLVWDDHQWLTHLNHKGDRQGQVRWPGGLAAACAADDGSAYAALGQRGEIGWLAPDLMARWQRSVRQAAVAGCLDLFGQYLAVSDARGGVTLFDRNGRQLWQVATPLPLHHLAFVPEQPVLVGCGEIGLVMALDFKGQVLWRDGLAANIGSLAVTADRVVVSCFSEGLRLYGLNGQKVGQHVLPEPVRCASVSYDGRLTLALGLTHRLMLVDHEGRVQDSATVDPTPTAQALEALGDRTVIALAEGRVICVETGV